MFGLERLELAVGYADLLASDGVTRGLIGPRESPRLWDRHLLNCAVLGEVVPEGATVADVGSGAGLPGLVLAIARADLRVTLIEPLLRRIRFLEEAVAMLGLEQQVEVLRGRAEEIGPDRTFGVVTARAVAPLERLAQWCLPLVAPGGELVAMKGATAHAEVAAALPGLRTLGCGPAVVVELGEGLLEEPTWVVRLARPETGPVGWRDRPGPTQASGGARPKRRSRQQRRGA